MVRSIQSPSFCCHIFSRNFKPFANFNEFRPIYAKIENGLFQLMTPPPQKKKLDEEEEEEAGQRTNIKHH